MSFENLIDVYESASADANGDYTFSYSSFPLIVGVADSRQIELQWTPSQVTRTSDGVVISINDLSPSDATLAAIVPATSLVFDLTVKSVKLDQSEYVGTTFTGDNNVIYERTELVLPTDARPIYVKRSTPLDAKLVTYQSGSKIAASTMNLADDQYFNALQEVKAGVDLVAGNLSTVGTIEVSIAPKGSVPTAADLPVSAAVGDLYVTLDTGDAYTYNGTSWDNIGPLRGQDGATGTDGDAATIAVGTVTPGTAADGSDASVTNVGTTSAAVLDFVVPRGPEGPQGIQGETGADSTVEGPAGPAGADRAMALVYDVEYAVGQAPGGQQMYSMVRTYGSTNADVASPIDDTLPTGAALVTANVIEYTQGGQRVMTNSNGASQDAGFSVRPGGATNDVRIVHGFNNALTDVTVQYFYYKGDPIANITLDDFNVLELDNYIAPTHLLYKGREYMIGQAPDGRKLYSKVIELTGNSLVGVEVWDEGALGSIDGGSTLVDAAILSGVQSNNSQRFVDGGDRYFIRETSVGSGVYELQQANSANINGPCLVQCLYSKASDPVEGIVTAPEYAQLEAIYADPTSASSTLLKLNEEYLVGQAPDGRPLYSTVVEVVTSGATEVWDESASGIRGEETTVHNAVILTHTLSTGRVLSGEAGSVYYCDRDALSTKWEVNIGANGTARVHILYSKDSDPPSALVSASEYATLALSTYQSPALSFNTSTSQDIQVGTWTTGQPLYKRSYEFASGLANGDTLWTDTGVEQSVMGRIVLFEGSGSTIRSYDDSDVFVELTPQSGVDQRIAKIVGGGITNSIIDRYFIKTDETAADIDEIVGIPDAPSDGNQYAREDGAWAVVTGGGGGGGASELDDLSDVNTTGVADGDLLVYDTSGPTDQFLPRALTSADITNFAADAALEAPIQGISGGTDIDIVDLTNGFFRVDYTGSGGGGGAVASVNGQTGTVVLDNTDVGAAATSHTHTASDVTDFDTEAAAAAPVQSIVAGTNVTVSDDGSGNVTVNASGGGGGASAINDLTDVDTSGAASGDALVYDGADWNSESGRILPASIGTAGQILGVSGSEAAWIDPVTPARALDSLSDVLYFDIDTNATGTPAAGDVLTMTSFGQWGFAAPTVGGGGSTTILKLDEEVLVGQAPDGKKLYSITKSYTSGTHLSTPIDDTLPTDARFVTGEIITFTQSGRTSGTNSNGTSSDAGFSVEPDGAANDVTTRHGFGSGLTAVTIQYLYTKASESPVTLVTADEFAEVTLPTGGTAGQALTKIDGTDGNVEWSTISGGGGGSSMSYLQVDYDETSIQSIFNGAQTEPDVDETTEISSGDESLDANQRYEIPTTGVYRLHLMGRCLSTTTTRYSVSAQFYVNGVATGPVFNDYGRDDKDGCNVIGTRLFSLTAGDTVSAGFGRGDAGSIDVSGGYGSFAYEQIS